MTFRITLRVLLEIRALLFADIASADGDLDPNFGTNGIAVSSVASAGGYVRGLAVQPDGKIVTCDRGNLSAPSAADFYIVRFDSDGSLDPTFGSGGRTYIDFGGNDYCNAVAIQADGKVIVAGSTGNPSTGDVEFAIARLNTDGTPDFSFGGLNGTVSLSFATAGTTASANALAIQGSGAILIVGSAGSDVALARLLPDGTLDSSFGADGELLSHFGLNGGGVQGRAIALDSLGRIIIVAAGGGSDGRNNFLAARLLADGTADMAFGVEGFATVFFNYGGTNDASANAVAIDEDDKIILAGSADISPTTTTQNYQYAVARLDVDGKLDPSFGSQGQSVVAFADADNQARSVAIQTNGLIVLAGSALPSSGGSVATATRLNADGSPDSNFGERTYNLGASGAGFFSMIVSGINIYAASFLPVSGGNDDAVVKLTNDQVFGNGFN